MEATHHFTRIDTRELKDQIYRKIGHERAEKYFNELKRFLNLKLNKVEFDKICIQTIGRENISLHNHLIRSVVQNAHYAKIPPQKAQNNGLGIRVENVYQKNHLQTHKCVSHVNRKFRAAGPSPLGPLGKSSSVTYEETGTRIIDCNEDGEEVEQFSGSFHCPLWNHVSAPFGVSLNKDGARKASSIKYGRSEGFCQSSGVLPDTVHLRNRLEKDLVSKGLGISIDCCNLLNKSLDAFMNKLIEPCLGISGSRCNGRQSAVKSAFVSMTDFQVVMESNPHRIHGEDWRVKFERSAILPFER